LAADTVLVQVRPVLLATRWMAASVPAISSAVAAPW
jgi:hypothetical protein